MVDTERTVRVPIAALLETRTATDGILGQGSDVVLNAFRDHSAVVPRDAFQEVYTAASGAIILLRAGRSVAHRMAPDRDALAAFFDQADIGDLEIDTLTEQEAVFHLQDSAEAYEDGEASCPFVKGLLIGFFEEHIGESSTREHVVGEETDCIAAGDDRCTFRVKSTLEEFTSYYG